MAAVTGQRVVDFLGGGSEIVAGVHADVVTNMVRAYTRGEGFVDGVPNEEIAAVIVTASARLVANPEQLSSSVGNISNGVGFNGFNLAELFVLNRYRKRAQ